MNAVVANVLTAMFVVIEIILLTALAVYAFRRLRR